MLFNLVPLISLRYSYMEYICQQSDYLAVNQTKNWDWYFLYWELLAWQPIIWLMS